MPIRSYRDIEAYQRAKALVKPVYEIVRRFPPCERYDLCDQMRRACKSVVANIVEGYGHKDTPPRAKDFWRFSMGSANEMIEHLETAITLGYLSQERGRSLIEQYAIVAKQLNRLIRNWRRF